VRAVATARAMSHWPCRDVPTGRSRPRRPGGSVRAEAARGGTEFQPSSSGPGAAHAVRLSEYSGRCSNWCSIHATTSLAGRTYVLIRYMVQVTPRTGIRSVASGPAAGMPVRSWPGADASAAAGILRRDLPDRQADHSAACGGDQRHGPATGAAWEPGTRRLRHNDRPRQFAEPCTVTNRLGTPGTGYPLEVSL